MPGSTTFFPAADNDEVANKPQHNMMGTRQPPPVAPRTTSITLQSWQQATAGGDANYGDERYARSASTDSLESSGSSSSGGGSANNRISDIGTVEYIPTRTVGKTPKLPSHNPLQFVKVQSPLYKKGEPDLGVLKKAEQQIKLTKEVKITREALKEGEEEWQSNLDNWKSRRRKVSEKVIQRAEEMRQIEAEEQLRQEQLLQQQKKIKKFSEIVEKKSTRSYNLELYIGQGDDSGLGGTPEPDDMLDCQSSLLRSDTSEGMTSEAESVDSDIHKSDKVVEKEPPKVPQKPYSRFKKSTSVCYDDNEANSNELFQHCLSRKDLSVSDNNSSTDPSDVEGHAADTEATSSEEDATFSGQIGNTDSGLESLGDSRRGDLADSASDLSQDSSTGLDKSHDKLHLNLISDELGEDKKPNGESPTSQINDAYNQSFRITIKHGDNKGFGFTLKGGKDQGSPAYIENVTKGGPADEMGLRDGDKIISLNGELTADYSHASLIFSIKQAVYTGILDIIINRSSENSGILNPEIKPRESRKGKSFAEKLAIFSAGITTPTSIEDSKSNAKLVETKRESLVLRRRSAFENGKVENGNANALNRRASCISRSVNIHPEKILEKRHSVDFILSQNVVLENNFNKKGPPPPVPVKPKIKSKPNYFDLNKSVIKINGTTESSLSSSDSIINDTENHSSKSLSDQENLDILEDRFLQEKQSQKSENIDESSEINKTNLTDDLNTEESNLPFKDSVICGDVLFTNDQSYYNEELPIPDDSTNFDDVGDNITDKIFTSFEANEHTEQVQEILNENETLIETTNETSYSFFNETEDFISDSNQKLIEDSYEPEPEAGTSEEICTEAKLLSEETSLHVDVQSTTECAIEFSNDINSEDCLEKESVKETEINSVSSACNSACDNENYLDESPDTECKVAQEAEDSEDMESKSNSQANTSPLCLSLEKIDEDDVISASTTTSSDTPDTETVIETLPSNLSPLPNDESDGEDSSKILNCQDEESDQPLEPNEANEMSSSDANAESENVQNFGDNEMDEQIETPEDKLAQPYDIPISDSMNEENYYNDQQDDEYAQELEESLDQITSLDIIDRIEQSLMDQLQKEDPFEDMSTNLNSQLESDIDNPWLYYSEESELLDDLTPRNLEPPREPPPPPPPPESEISDNKPISITRTNSTKRIKKELWRRRSDFLGIESPEGIDVDNIPPPPPGLEELLKQEREQTQWLEKRLSLAEPEIDISSYSTESACLDSGNYSNNDYSDYFVDDNAESAKEAVIDSEQEQWKENMGEETPYETTFGIQYESEPETLSTVIEEPAKPSESPQHKAKQNIQNLGAAPKAKIMDSTKWITEKVTTINKKAIEPVFRQASYNQNYWLAQDGERRRSMQYAESHADRRYSMPPVYSNAHPDVTVRTWGDREYEYQQHRPRSAVYGRSGCSGNVYDQYMSMDKKDLQRTQSLDSHRDMNYETDTLESEVHKCSCCGKGLCEGSAMGIEALRLYFHIECFRCCLCHMQLGNGSCGTDVQVKNNQLYCPSCFTVD